MRIPASAGGRGKSWRNARFPARTCFSQRTRYPHGAAVRFARQSDMRTALCDQLGIDLPIFAFSHCRDVVAAVSKAGGLGVLGAVGFKAEQLEVELAWIDEHVGDKPYGVDIVIPGKYEGMQEVDVDKLETMLRAAIPH